LGKKRTLLAAAIATALTSLPSARPAEAAAQSARSPGQGGTGQGALTAAPTPRVAPAPAATSSATPAAAPAPKPEPSWPKTLSETKAEAAAAGPPEVWPEEEIRRAKAFCAQILHSVGAVAVPVAPIRDGMCGAPAPVQLIGVGTNPQVVISPPATLTCEMVAALATWLKNDLQPLAQRHLGASITRLRSLSSYSCRNASGRAKSRLSEHGRANALDISGFVTASMQTTELLSDWGMTAREIRAQVAATKAAAEAAEQAMAKVRTPASFGQGLASGRHGQPTMAATDASPEPSRGTIIEGAPEVSSGLLSATSGAWSTSLGFAPPSRLGGPTPQQAAAEPTADQSLDRRAQFLRAAHASACRIFGTVLGPEANEAHRNHLHLDMAERSSGAFCR
jgi:hypothetical protein